jgi:hypothetical protein
LAARINALFKLSIIAALLVASSGVAYYYAVYLPRMKNAPSRANWRSSKNRRNSIRPK